MVLGYIEVGGKVTYIMALYIIYPHLLYLMALPYFRKKREKKFEEALIQREMNDNSLGPEFTVTQYYAITLNTIFVTLFYSSGLPILLWFAFFSLLIQYWVYKYMILRYNKRPPSYDHRLNKDIINILPLAIIMHLMIGNFQYNLIDLINSIIIIQVFICMEVRLFSLKMQVILKPISPRICLRITGLLIIFFLLMEKEVKLLIGLINNTY